ncbi:MAG: hypothetical protein ABEH81_11555 [Halopenitus sp.]
MKSKVLVVTVFIFLILFLVPTSSGNVRQEIVHQEEVISDYNVKFSVTFYGNMSVRVEAVNQARYTRDSLYSISVDMTRGVYNNMTLSPGQSETWVHNLSHMPNPMETQQNVLFAIVGTNIQHTYNRTTNAEDSDDVLMAEISDVNIQRSNESDETELVVTVKDPSPHKYQMTLVLYSEKTHRKLGHPSKVKKNTYKARISLNEDPGELIKGELRLYSDEIFEANSTMDMVTFKGRTNGTTTSKEVEFERIDDPANYYYGIENDSDEDELAVTNDGNVTNLGIAAGMLGAGALALLSMIVVGIRRKLG